MREVSASIVDRKKVVGVKSSWGKQAIELRRCRKQQAALLLNVSKRTAETSCMAKKY